MSFLALSVRRSFWRLPVFPSPRRRAAALTSAVLVWAVLTSAGLALVVLALAGLELPVLTLAAAIMAAGPIVAATTAAVIEVTTMATLGLTGARLPRAQLSAGCLRRPTIMIPASTTMDLTTMVPPIMVVRTPITDHPITRPTNIGQSSNRASH